eukprot:3318708-Pleurochrysis_carterae.AAC.3
MLTNFEPVAAAHSLRPFRFELPEGCVCGCVRSVGAAAQSAPVPHAADVSNATSDAIEPSAKSSAKFSAKSSAVDADGGAPSPRFSAYAKQTLLAIAHARHTFSSLRLHNRVAIAVPDQAGRDEQSGARARAREGERARESSAL